MKSTVEKVHDYVLAFPGNSISLRETAERFHYNASYFNRAFKAECGEEFNEYVKRMKIEYAMELAVTSDLKVRELAAAVGFNDVRYFTKLFTSIAGDSPLEYRRNHSL